MSWFDRVAIRCLDILLSSLILVVVLVPFILLVVVMIIFQGLPVFYVQQRYGQDKKLFNIYKFRTMETHSTAKRAEQAHLEEARITVLGAYLRRTNLDEFPQLLNVLVGEMSLVGPRPHEKYQDEAFRRQYMSYSKRYRLKPGITGLAQIRGFNGPIRDEGFMRSRISHDLLMIRRFTVWRYLAILFETFWYFLINIVISAKA